MPNFDKLSKIIIVVLSEKANVNKMLILAKRVPFGNIKVTFVKQFRNKSLLFGKGRGFCCFWKKRYSGGGVGKAP